MAQSYVFRDFLARMAALDVRPAEYAVLLLVGANPGCCLAELATAMEVRASNLVRIIDDAVSRGLLTRQADPHNRRTNRLTLTPAGRRLTEELKAIHASHVAHLSARLGPGETEELLRLLAKIRAG